MAVGLRALIHLHGDHLALDFARIFLPSSRRQAQAQGRQRDFYGSLPGTDIHLDVFAGGISAINFGLQFNGLAFAMASG